MSDARDCAACGAVITGELKHAIHEDDSFEDERQVEICVECGGDVLPTCDALWSMIAYRKARGSTFRYLPPDVESERIPRRA